MRFLHFKALTLVLGLAVAPAISLAAQAPANATGSCKDGSFTTAKSKSGACSNHGGVKMWGAPAAAPAPKMTPKSSPAMSKPTDATGMCTDGSYTSAKSKSGACSNHRGVKTWYTGTTGTPTPTMAPPPRAPSKSMTAPTSAPSKTMSVPAASKRISPAPAGAPANATAVCNDGTYSMSQHHRGTCSSHKGVKSWLKDIPAL